MNTKNDPRPAGWLRRLAMHWLGLGKSPLEGKRVTVMWKDEDCDWTEFTILEDDGVRLRLRGEMQDGAPHDGVPFWCHWNEINGVREVHSGESSDTREGAL